METREEFLIRLNTARGEPAIRKATREARQYLLLLPGDLEVGQAYNSLKVAMATYE